MTNNLKFYVEKEILKEKYSFFALHHRRLFESQVDALFLLRSFLVWTKEHTHPLGRRINRIRLERRYGIFCGKDVEIGVGISLPHPQGIVFGKGTVIGENVTVYQQVTFGGKIINTSKDRIMYPSVGNNCVLYKGATIVGAIRLEDNTIVGANAFLNISTTAGTYVGVPARRVK